MSDIKLTRVWEMPSKWTFRMKAVQRLFETYNVGRQWIDPFAGETSPAEFTNDAEGRIAKVNLDALQFLDTTPSESITGGALFDPPYSTEQCLRLYTPKHNGTAGRAEYWAKCKTELARILAPNALCISFCWDSTGLGAKRGFEIIEILLICHGACHNDTIVTVERKTKGIT